MEEMQVADDLISLGSSRPLIRFLFCIACLFSSEASGWYTTTQYYVRVNIRIYQGPMTLCIFRNIGLS